MSNTTQKYERESEHATPSLWFIARKADGWYLVDLNTYEELSGPFREHSDAVTNADTRAYRIAQGWAP